MVRAFDGAQTTEAAGNRSQQTQWGKKRCAEKCPDCAVTITVFICRFSFILKQTTA